MKAHIIQLKIKIQLLKNLKNDKIQKGSFLVILLSW
jgi:hypothetical protein